MPAALHVMPGLLPALTPGDHVIRTMCSFNDVDVVIYDVRETSIFTT